MIEPTWRECSGAYSCSALEHIEGCFAPAKLDKYLGQIHAAAADIAAIPPVPLQDQIKSLLDDHAPVYDPKWDKTYCDCPSVDEYREHVAALVADWAQPVRVALGVRQ